MGLLLAPVPAKPGLPVMAVRSRSLLALKATTNWLPLTVAALTVTDAGAGVVLVTVWFWKLLASVPAEAWITLPEAPSPAGSVELTVAVSPLFTARDSVSVTVLSAFTRTLLTVMAALPAVALATEKPGLPVMAVRSRSLLALKATTNWLPLTVAPLPVTGAGAGVLLVTAWFWKLLASVPAESWITLPEASSTEGLGSV